MNEWLTDWRDSKQLGLTRQIFNALICTNNAIADLCSDLLESGYQFILTGRLQTDPLERRFSLYRRMSIDLFLVSLKEVLQSESIVKMKTLLKRNLDLEDFSISSTETEAQIQQFISDLDVENFDHLQLSEGAQQVAVYIACYITQTLIKDTSCDDYLHRLKEDQVTNSYLDTLNRGGLKLPSMSLHSYVRTEFCVIEENQPAICSSGFPSKVLAATTF